MRIIDSHTHIFYHNPKKLLEMADRYAYEKICAVSIPCDGLKLNNLECLLLKKLAPGRAYVYGGITYLPDVEPNGADHRRELELLVDAGCDGWKLLESKPAVYRRLQIPLDSDVFDGAFGFAEETGLPIVWHAGDPATFWDASQAPAFAVENNWLCIGEGYPTLEAIYRQVEHVLEKHPRLRATMAHLYFTSDNRPYGCRMLDSYENLWFDVTPGSEMYWAFIADRKGWTEFFERYQDKLVYGTDMMDYEGDVVYGSQDVIVDFVMRTLVGDKPFTVKEHGGTGLGLSEHVLRRLMCENFEKRNGQPKPLNPAGLERYVAWLMPRLDQETKQKCEAMLEQF